MNFVNNRAARAAVAEALLDFSVCEEWDRFNPFFKSLRFRNFVVAEGSMDARAQALVYHCALDPRSIPNLLRTLRDLCGDEPDHITALTSALDGAISRTVGFAEWLDLDRLLERNKNLLSDARARDAFYLMVPYEPEFTPDRTGLGWQTAVELLSEKSLATNSSHPLFGFLELCQNALDLPTATAVAQWELAVANRLGHSPTTLRGNLGAAALPAAFQAANRLQIVVQQPTECDPEDPVYRVRAWFRPTDPATHPVPLHLPELRENGQPATDLRLLLPSLIRAAQQRDPGGRLLVEVALPLELLSLELDTVRWKTDSDELCGQLVPIVVRSLDRMPVPGREDAARHAVKWGKLGTSIAAEAVVWAGDPDDPEALAFFSLSPIEPSRPDGLQGLRRLLIDQGLPLGVWLRRDAPREKPAVARLSRELIEVDHREWPERARTLRRKKDTVLPPFTLLWDDPTFPPPTAAAPLRIPS